MRPCCTRRAHSRAALDCVDRDCAWPIRVPTWQANVGPPGVCARTSAAAAGAHSHRTRVEFPRFRWSAYIGSEQLDPVPRLRSSRIVLRARTFLPLRRRLARVPQSEWPGEESAKSDDRAGGRCHPRLGRTRGARRAGDRRRRRSCPWPSQKRFAAFCGLIEDAPQLAVALWTARDCSSLPHSPSVGVTGRHHGAGAGTQRIALGCAGAESWAEGARFGPRCGSTPPSEPRRRHAAGHQPGSKSSRSLSRTMIGIETPQWQQTDAAVRRPPSARRCERCVSPGSES
jgi:hypothetical protein